MADETTTADTTQSTNEAPATEQSQATTATANDAPAEQPAAEEEAGEGTVLGGDAQADEPEGATEVAEPEGAPEKYELALEGVDLDPEMLAAADPVLRELNLSNDQANTLLPVANQLVERTRDGVMQQLVDAASEQRADWLAIAKKDEIIGGKNWDDTVHLAAKGLDALGFTEGTPFRQALTETGFGNHRDMIFAMRKVGEMVGEDGAFVRSDAGATVETDVAKRLYPND